MGKFSFWFLNCYIGQPSQPVSVKLPSSSCLEPWPHPGKGTLPMPDQAGKLSSERNGGYTRLKGPFHPAEGQGVNCPLSGPSGSGPAWEEKLFPQGKQCSCTVCVHITAELVPSSLFIQCCTCVHFIALLVSQLGSSQGKYTCICLGLDRMSSSINLLLFKRLSGTFQNILQKYSGLEDSRTFLMQSLYNCTLPWANLTSILYAEPL